MQLSHFRQTQKPLSALLPAEHEQYINDYFTEEQIEQIEGKKRKEIDLCIKSLIPAKVLNIVLLGESGSGKSSLGNLILGEEKFKVSSGTTACTSKIDKSDCLVDGMLLNVIDTPGWLRSNAATSEAIKVLYHITLS